VLVLPTALQSGKRGRGSSSSSSGSVLEALRVSKKEIVQTVCERTGRGGNDSDQTLPIRMLHRGAVLAQDWLRNHIDVHFRIETRILSIRVLYCSKDTSRCEWPSCRVPTIRPGISVNNAIVPNRSFRLLFLLRFTFRCAHTRRVLKVLRSTRGGMDSC
jgi:hypothetical protein